MCQINRGWSDSDIGLFPHTTQDIETIKEFKPNQIVRVKIYGVTKERSYQQLKLYWACCQTVADNSKEWTTKEEVDFQCRVACRWCDFRVVNGATIVVVKSISFKDMSHLVACNYFDRAFEIMAKHLKIKVNVLLKEVEHG